MPNRISTDLSAFTPSAGANPVPARFNSPELSRVWNGWPALNVGARGEGVRAVQAALSRPGRKKLTEQNVRDVNLFTFDAEKLRWPRGRVA